MIHFDISKLELELVELEKQTLEEGFWTDTAKSTSILAKVKSLKNKCNTYQRIYLELNNLQELTQLVQLENDEQMANDILKNTEIIRKRT